MFSKAPWWQWGYAVLGSVVRLMEDEPRWEKIEARWKRPLLLMMGGMGEVELNNTGLVFDQDEGNIDRLSKMYSLAKPELDRAWDAVRHGLFLKKMPFEELVNAPRGAQG